MDKEELAETKAYLLDALDLSIKRGKGLFIEDTSQGDFFIYPLSYTVYDNDVAIITEDNDYLYFTYSEIIEVYADDGEDVDFRENRCCSSHQAF